MKPSDEDRAILAHRKVDVDAWVAHAVANVGEWAVRDAIANHREPYLTELANRGPEGYKPRAVRQAEEDAEHAARIAQIVADHDTAEAQKAESEAARIAALVDEAVTKALASRAKAPG